MAVLTLNLESGMPTVAVAQSRMASGLRSARAGRVTVVKLIHGYGSTGTGGKIRTQVRRTLTQMKASGEICTFVAGEDFSPFDEDARRMLVLCPELSRDRDFLRCNQGVTMVAL